MAENFVKVGDRELWSQDFGYPGDPAILLVHGAGTQGTWWEEELCDRLVAPGRYVIRYDERDAGQSTSRPFEQSPYDLEDLAAEAIGVLDAYGISSAHVVGLSVGGMISLYCGLNHPDRVKTITSVYTSPVLREAIEAFMLGQPIDCDLPLAYPTDYPELKQTMEETALHPPETREQHIEALLDALRLGGGSRYPLDEAHWRPIVAASYDRAQDWDLRNNAYSAILSSPYDARARLRGLAIPVLAISGSDDSICKPEHGEAIATSVLNGRFVLIEGTGHSIHHGVYPVWAEEIIKHTA